MNTIREQEGQRHLKIHAGAAFTSMMMALDRLHSMGVYSLASITKTSESRKSLDRLWVFVHDAQCKLRDMDDVLNKIDAGHDFSPFRKHDDETVVVNYDNHRFHVVVNFTDSLSAEELHKDSDLKAIFLDGCRADVRGLLDESVVDHLYYAACVTEARSRSRQQFDGDMSSFQEMQAEESRHERAA